MTLVSDYRIVSHLKQNWYVNSDIRFDLELEYSSLHSRLILGLFGGRAYNHRVAFHGSLAQFLTSHLCMQLQYNKYTFKKVKMIFNGCASQFSPLNQLHCKYDEYNKVESIIKSILRKKKKNPVSLYGLKSSFHTSWNVPNSHPEKNFKCENSKVENHLRVLKNKNLTPVVIDARPEIHNSSDLSVGCSFCRNEKTIV